MTRTCYGVPENRKIFGVFAKRLLLEVVEVLLVGIAPLDLAGCTQSWQELVEGMLGICHVLCPKIYLGTKDKPLLLLGEAVGDKGLEGIYLAGKQ